MSRLQPAVPRLQGIDNAALSVVATELHLSGPFGDQIGNLDENFGFLGVIIACLFIGCWIISTIIYKVKRYDTFEVNMAPAKLEY